MTLFVVLPLKWQFVLHYTLPLPWDICHNLSYLPHPNPECIINGDRKIMDRWLFDINIEIYKLLRVTNTPSTSNYYGGSDSLLRSYKAAKNSPLCYSSQALFTSVRPEVIRWVGTTSERDQSPKDQTPKIQGYRQFK